MKYAMKSSKCYKFIALLMVDGYYFDDVNRGNPLHFVMQSMTTELEIQLPVSSILSSSIYTITAFEGYQIKEE